MVDFGIDNHLITPIKFCTSPVTLFESPIMNHLPEKLLPSIDYSQYLILEMDEWT